MNTAPKLARRYPAAHQMSDTQLGDRIATLHRRLSTLADRHCQLIEDLRPENPTPWPEEPNYPPLLLNPIVIR
jgi:hypothetical protein